MRSHTDLPNRIGGGIFFKHAVLKSVIDKTQIFNESLFCKHTMQSWSG